MNATITTLTPVHIGNGTTYNRNIDFIQYNDKIGIIDENKVLSILGENYIDQWVAAINKGNNEFINLLKSRGWKQGDLESVCSRIMVSRQPESKATQLKEIYRTNLKGITIPGSSLKGSIRTAVFDSFITEEDKTIEGLTMDDISSRRFGKIKFESKKLEQRYLGKNANESSTRFIKVGDAHFTTTNAQVNEMQILNMYRSGWGFKRGQQILLEAIPARAKAHFSFSIDKDLLKLNKLKEPHKWPGNKLSYLNSNQDIFTLINKFTRSLINFDWGNLENEDLQDAEQLCSTYQQLNDQFDGLKEGECILRVGGNSGYLFTTGHWVGFDNVMDISNDDFNLLRKKVQRRDYSHMEMWPKTRKTTNDSELFGFVKISVHN